MLGSTPNITARELTTAMRLPERRTRFAVCVRLIFTVRHNKRDCSDNGGILLSCMTIPQTEYKSNAEVPRNA